jgi:hypothetical protein
MPSAMRKSMINDNSDKIRKGARSITSPLTLIITTVQVSIPAPKPNCIVISTAAQSVNIKATTFPMNGLLFSLDKNVSCLKSTLLEVE